MDRQSIYGIHSEVCERVGVMLEAVSSIYTDAELEEFAPPKEKVTDDKEDSFVPGRPIESKRIKRVEVIEFDSDDSDIDEVNRPPVPSPSSNLEVFQAKRPAPGLLGMLHERKTKVDTLLDQINVDERTFEIDQVNEWFQNYAPCARGEDVELLMMQEDCGRAGDLIENSERNVREHGQVYLALNRQVRRVATQAQKAVCQGSANSYVGRAQQKQKDARAVYKQLIKERAKFTDELEATKQVLEDLKTQYTSSMLEFQYGADALQAAVSHLEEETETRKKAIEELSGDIQKQGASMGEMNKLADEIRQCEAMDRSLDGFKPKQENLANLLEEIKGKVIEKRKENQAVKGTSEYAGMAATQAEIEAQAIKTEQLLEEQKALERQIDSRQQLLQILKANQIEDGRSRSRSLSGTTFPVAAGDQAKEAANLLGLEQVLEETALDEEVVLKTELVEVIAELRSQRRKNDALKEKGQVLQAVTQYCKEARKAARKNLIDAARKIVSEAEDSPDSVTTIPPRMIPSVWFHFAETAWQDAKDVPEIWSSLFLCDNSKPPVGRPSAQQPAAESSTQARHQKLDISSPEELVLEAEATWTALLELEGKLLPLDKDMKEALIWDAQQRYKNARTESHLLKTRRKGITPDDCRRLMLAVSGSNEASPATSPLGSPREIKTLNEDGVAVRPEDKRSLAEIMNAEEEAAVTRLMKFRERQAELLEQAGECAKEMARGTRVEKVRSMIVTAGLQNDHLLPPDVRVAPSRTSSSTGRGPTDMLRSRVNSQ
eukprot:TRINITY_DN2342_c1_g2_i1.p1 TRINITY_DN2342_c1_g2~~TRINITY_DN2342_c1_g2_i1.p1  ORF type:complete len:896 (-),score=178.28 TRINITY_DN2342_c1_g2_i1:333-2657(-)